MSLFERLSMPTPARDTLPDFERPPIEELVLSIQFADLPFKNYHSGLLWKKFANQYPKVEEHPPIDPVFETFGAPRPSPPQQLRLMSPDEPSRYWFVSSDGRELLQVQRDRVIHNWRSRGEGDFYPRYEPLRERLSAEINLVREFFRDSGLGEIRCNQSEVTYINSIAPIENGIDPNGQLEEIFTIWREHYSDDALRHTERARFNVSYEILDDNSKEPSGRLHIGVSPGLRLRDSVSVIRFNLTARGRPQDDTIEAALKWLDRGRRAVVQGFVSITTEKMHRLWGKKERQ